MVKGEPKMNGTGEQENTTTKTLEATKGKMKVQQRMIDLTARELDSTRIAMSSEKDDRAVFDENLSIIEVLCVHCYNCSVMQCMLLLL